MEPLGPAYYIRVVIREPGVKPTQGHDFIGKAIRRFPFQTFRSGVADDQFGAPCQEEWPDTVIADGRLVTLRDDQLGRAAGKATRGSGYIERLPPYQAEAMVDNRFRVTLYPRMIAEGAGGAAENQTIVGRNSAHYFLQFFRVILGPMQHTIPVAEVEVGSIAAETERERPPPDTSKRLKRGRSYLALDLHARAAQFVDTTIASRRGGQQDQRAVA